MTVAPCSRNRRLYLVAAIAELDACCERALAGGVDIVQLRDQGGDATTSCSPTAAPLRAACAEAGAPFILNDRPDLVDAAGADGVHVGQDDMTGRRGAGARRRRPRSSACRRTRPAQWTPPTGVDYFGVGPCTRRRRSQGGRPSASS